VVTLRYGDDVSQLVELVVPPDAGGPVPVAVVIHGGFWRDAYDMSLGRPLSATMPAIGWAALTIEYRRVGNGGGYPATLDDVGAAIDLLATAGLDAAAEAGAQLDLDRVITIGHSAGGHLAVWAATRTDPAVPIAGAVAQAGVLDLRQAAADQLGAGATQAFLGGEPNAVPQAYEEASPIEHLPLGIPVLCVHGTADDIVPIGQSRSFVERAVAAGDEAELAEVQGDHFVVIDPASAAWRTTLDWLARRFA